MKNQHFAKKGLCNTKRLCYNWCMPKTKMKVMPVLAGLLLAVSALLSSISPNSAFAEECTASPCDTSFQVNVKESLSVSITVPQEWASGDIDTFLRNTVSLNVKTNSASGFTAYMYSKDTTNLTNAVSSTSSPITLPTLSNTSTRGQFDTNHWGYSLRATDYNGVTYGETEAGASSSNYYPMTTSNIQILDNTAGNDRDVYFGAKANMGQASGTYLGTVVFNVVTSTPPTPPTPTPTPVNPDDDNPGDSVPTYDNNNDRTVYTTISSTGSGSTGTTTTTTEITNGDNTSMYPLGETRRTESNISEGSQVATGLAVAASTAAASGMIFFILAKRREDDEEDEEELQ